MMVPRYRQAAPAPVTMASGDAPVSAADGEVDRWPLMLWVGSAIMLIVLLTIYAPSMPGPFLYDDRGHVFDNPAIESFPPKLQWWRPETRPLGQATFAIDRIIWGQWPGGYRLTNVMIQWVSFIVLADLASRLMSVRRVRLGNNIMMTVPLWIAAIWAVHPLTSQAVAYVVQRYESLMGLCFLIYLWCIVRHATGPSWHWLTLGWVAFAAGLSCKTVMITAPAVGYLMDRAWLNDSVLQTLRRRGAFYLPPLVLGGVAAALILPALLIGGAHVGFGDDAPPVDRHLAGQAVAMLGYARRIVWPTDLSLDHGLKVPADWLAVWPSIALVSVWVVGGLAAWFSGRRRVGFTMLAPLVILSPTSTIVPTADLMVEHRMWLPLAMIVMGAGILLTPPMAAMSRQTNRSRIQWTLCIVVLLTTAGLAMATHHRAGQYASAVTLWESALQLNPNNPRAAQNLSHAAVQEGRGEELIGRYVTLVNSSHPRMVSSVVMGRLGEELLKAGRIDDAYDVLRRAVDDDPTPELLENQYLGPVVAEDIAGHRINLALALAAKGRADEALRRLDEAFAIDDSLAQPRAIAGDIAARSGRPDEATVHFRRALELQPGWPEVERQLRSFSGPGESR